MGWISLQMYQHAQPWPKLPDTPQQIWACKSSFVLFPDTIFPGDFNLSLRHFQSGHCRILPVTANLQRSEIATRTRLNLSALIMLWLGTSEMRMAYFAQFHAKRWQNTNRSKQLHSNIREMYLWFPSPVSCVAFRNTYRIATSNSPAV